MQQAVERQVKGLIVTKTETTMTLMSHPFGWKVYRTHEDFEALRAHLIKSFPQTLVPGLPSIKHRKEYT